VWLIYADSIFFSPHQFIEEAIRTTLTFTVLFIAVEYKSYLTEQGKKESEISDFFKNGVIGQIDKVIKVLDINKSNVSEVGLNELKFHWRTLRDNLKNGKFATINAQLSNPIEEIKIDELMVKIDGYIISTTTESQESDIDGIIKELEKFKTHFAN
jgi:hypothetical protein